MFNASGKDDDPLCLPNTRVDVLKQIRTWADGDDGRYIFWLSGWAGTGKSTIARTIAREYYDKRCLGASFFFSKDEKDVSHAGKFVASIAVQLARSPVLRGLIQEAISNNDGIVSKVLQDQWKELILEPLSKLEASPVPIQLVIVIDALDECDRDDIGRVLQLLANVRIMHTVRFRVLITSRPEIPIRLGLSKVVNSKHQDFVLHDISQSIVDHDIFTFLKYELEAIRQRYTFGEDWPGEHDTRRLVRRAAGLFVWAATACRFIDEGELFAPDRLSYILQGEGSATEPERGLNNIYIKVLENSIGPCFGEQEKEKFYMMLRETLGAIVILFSPLSAPSLARLLHTPKVKIEATLGNLHSILDMPKDLGRPIRLHHPSFRDFLLDERRCSNLHFRVDEKEAHEALTDCCMRLMSDPQDGSREDICGLHVPGALASEVQDDLIEHCLPAELQYACRYWVQHLQKSRHHLHNDGPVHVFLREHLLHWFEALSLMKKTYEGILAITLLESIIKVGVRKIYLVPANLRVLRPLKVAIYVPMSMTQNDSSSITAQ